MRRSTRIFVPKSAVKDNHEGRVLRSGRGDDKGEWFKLLENSGDAYNRKRRRLIVENISSPDQSDDSVLVDWKMGISFLRKKRISDSPITDGRKKECSALDENFDSEVGVSRQNESFGNTKSSINIGSQKSLLAVEKGNTLRKSSAENMKEMESDLNMNLVCCNANVLVIESEKCYREKGAVVMLKRSTSKEWFVTVKIQNVIKYCYKVQDLMKPSTSNRYTHAVIWTMDSGWQLEFCNRRDWMIFKELHRECCKRNMQDVSVETISVPGVVEVPSYMDSEYVPFVRPNAYITTQGDEVFRALINKNATYDMDTDDEEWLQKFNNDFYYEGKGDLEPISEKNFEEMIDMFERDVFNNPNDVSDENRSTDICLNLGRRDFVAAVHQYWLIKRKQKCSALVRVFQCHPPQSQLVQNPIFRKRRSFRRHGVRCGKGKQLSVLQELAAEHNEVNGVFEAKGSTVKAMEMAINGVFEAKGSTVKATEMAINGIFEAKGPSVKAMEMAINEVESAKSSATKAVEFAIIKRRKVQLLMEYADLATYKATMSLKIAEAARIAESMDVAVTSVLS